MSTNLGAQHRARPGNTIKQLLSFSARLLDVLTSPYNESRVTTVLEEIADHLASVSRLILCGAQPSRLQERPATSSPSAAASTPRPFTPLAKAALDRRIGSESNDAAGRHSGKAGQQGQDRRQDNARGKEALEHERQLEDVGTELWNRCIHLRRAEPGQVPAKRKELAIKATALACCMLALPAKVRPERADANDAKRLLMVAINAGRHCLAGEDLDLSDTLLKQAADYLARLRALHDEKTKGRSKKTSDHRQTAQDDDGQFFKLEAEYLALRCVHAWKVDRLEVAEYAYSNTDMDNLFSKVDFEPAERLAEALFEIGRDLLVTRKDLPLATKWLERALESISSQRVDQLSREGIELRIATTQALVQAHIQSGTKESLTAAENLIAYLEQEIGDRQVVLLMRLELVCNSPDETLDLEAYLSTLKRMVRAFVNSESILRVLLHHIKQLFERSGDHACQVLDMLILTRLARLGKVDWLDRAVVIRIYLATRSNDGLRAAEKLKDTLAQLANDGVVLMADAAMAGQSLMWGLVERNISEGNLDVAELWCRLCLGDIFKNTGPANTAKITRKMILCALMRNSLEDVKDIFSSMSESVQNEPHTRYLLHKVAIQENNEELAAQCLEYVGASSDDRLLYACVMDAIASDQKMCALRALRKLTQKYNFQSPKVHLPALLRCTIRTNMSLLTSRKPSAGDGSNGGVNDESDAELIQCLCETFENAAAACAQRPLDNKGGKLFTVAEMDWFCRHAYNLVLQHMYTWNIGSTLAILTACLSMIAQYPLADLPLADAQEISLKTAFCHFLGASLRVAAARTEDDEQTQLQHYLETRKHVRAFDEILHSATMNEMLGMGDDSPVRDDLRAKLITLLVFEFEAALALRDYEGLRQVVRTASASHDLGAADQAGERGRTHEQDENDLRAYQAMADALLCAQVPAHVLSATMRLIVNEIWKLEHFDFAKLAKYFRCMFQAALPTSEEIALSLVDELVAMIPTLPALSSRLDTQCSSSSLPHHNPVASASADPTFTAGPITSRASDRNDSPSNINTAAAALGFPTVEIQWMSAVCFNHGLDIWGTGDEAGCRRWAERALNLAEKMQGVDGEAMRRDLHAKLALLIGLRNSSEGEEDGGGHSVGDGVGRAKDGVAEGSGEVGAVE